MQWNVGDKVRFFDAPGDGEITKVLDENRCMVEDDTGFEYEHNFKNLVRITTDAISERQAYASVDPDIREILDRNIDQDAVKVAKKDFEARYKQREPGAVMRKGHVMEVDLHVHELVDNERGLQSGDKLNLQISHFERMMKRAEQQKAQRVVFIHGVGEGVLRAEIRKMIELYYPNASFHDASYQEYGYGATEVRIRYN